MTHGVLAMYVGAVLFRSRGRNSGNGDGGRRREELTIDAVAPARGLSGDPAMVEDDYYRFLNQPRD